MGRRIADYDAEVITCLSGRSEWTQSLAVAAGIAAVPDYNELVARCDLVISIIVPSEAPKPCRLPIWGRIWRMWIATRSRRAQQGRWPMSSRRPEEGRSTPGLSVVRRAG